MSLIKCPDCGQSVSDSAKECKDCGFPISDKLIVCGECGIKVWHTEKACPECGFPTNKARLARQNKQAPVEKPPPVKEEVVKPKPVIHGPPPSQSMNVTQTVIIPESKTFAIITLLFYIFIWPIGLLLNAIGLFSGPSRGCFVQLLLFCVIIPTVGTLILIAMGFNIIAEIFNVLGDIF